MYSLAMADLVRDIERSIKELQKEEVKKLKKKG